MKLFLLAVFVVACGIVEASPNRPPPVIADSHHGHGHDHGRPKGASDQEVPVLRSESVVNPDGYNYLYETGNGIYAESSGVVKSVGQDSVLAVQGAFKYTGPDGHPYSVTYTADENGYQPVGDHIPQIPEAIARSLDYIRAHPAPVESSYRKP